LRRFSQRLHPQTQGAPGPAAANANKNKRKGCS
jgi:hypothetical protein